MKALCKTCSTVATCHYQPVGFPLIFLGSVETSVQVKYKVKV